MSKHMMKSHGIKIDKDWFQKFAQGEIQNTDYEPLCLWLIPILLRSREQYLEDSVVATRKKIKWFWQTNKRFYPSFTEFEQANFVRGIWQREAPVWWGLNDIIGWIDVRLCVRKREFQVSLFLPIKRISRKLKNKVYSCQLQEIITFNNHSNNKELQTLLIQCVEKLANDQRLKKRYINIKHWRRLVHHTNLLGLIQETTDENKE